MKRKEGFDNFDGMAELCISVLKLTLNDLIKSRSSNRKIRKENIASNGTEIESKTIIFK